MDAYRDQDVDSESDKIYDVDKGTSKSIITSVSNNCEYYTEEQFNDKVMLNGTLSLIHFNSTDKRLLKRLLNCCVRDMVKGWGCG